MRIFRLSLFIFCGILLIGAIALLLWANLPPRVEPITHQLHLIAPEVWGSEAGSVISRNLFELVIRCPDRIKSGQASTCSIALTGLPEFVDHGDSRERYWIQAELIAPGLLNQQEGLITENVQAGIPVQFSWSLVTQQPRRLTGVIRIYAVYGSSVQEGLSTLLSVTDLEMEASSMMGLTSNTSTSLAVALILLAGFAGALGWSRPRDGS